MAARTLNLPPVERLKGKRSVGVLPDIAVPPVRNIRSRLMPLLVIWLKRSVLFVHKTRRPCADAWGGFFSACGGHPSASVFLMITWPSGSASARSPPAGGVEQYCPPAKKIGPPEAEILAPPRERFP